MPVMWFYDGYVDEQPSPAKIGRPHRDRSKTKEARKANRRRR